MSMGSKIRFADTIRNLAMPIVRRTREQFDFNKVEWSDGLLTGIGTSGASRFSARLDFSDFQSAPEPHCSLCGRGGTCPHAAALLHLVNDAGIADEIEKYDFAPCTFSLNGKSARHAANAWKSRINDLATRFRYRPPIERVAAKFPAGREAIYVIQRERYSDSDDMLEIAIATRPTDPTRAPKRTPSNKYKSSSIYRNFAAGIRGLAASSDPLDREIAERVSMTTTQSFNYYEARREVRFSLSTDSSLELIARLARSGRLFCNSEYSLHDGILPLGWLDDDWFDLKFEIAEHEHEQLSLGICAANRSMTVAHKDLKIVSTSYFIDARNRLGLFRHPVASGIFDAIRSNKPILVPKDQSADLIQSVMKIPAVMGVEFVGCEDIRPTRITAPPKPQIHIHAPSPTSANLEASVHFDYDGISVEMTRRVAELFDKRRSAIVQIDTAFHEKSIELLTSLGVKMRQDYNGTRLTLGKNKLPSIVAQLIHHGWHVEADGKLYRTGSRFDIAIVSGIDWFELQGKAHFDEASVDLPRLLQSLRAGDRSVVLDDGSIGVIPEQWIKRFGGVATLGSAEDGSVKFSRSQLGLLDALLAERDDINIDEKFAEARNALRAFDRVHPQEPPAGFVGTLRPYQKLAQGWFEFLRTLGFGGCLADDMGLGKTIQVLSMLETRRELKTGPSLIVVPRSLVFNWIAEAGKFTPHIRILDQSHSQRRRATEHLSDFDLVITTYGTLRRDAAFLKDFEFDYVILDEAQAIKNAATEASKAARLLKSRHRLALSGTPIENHLGELWSLFDFLNPGMMGRVGRFGTLAQDADADERKVIAAAVRPFILRRTKKQVAPELPDRIEQTIVVELDEAERKGYDELRDYYRQALMSKIDADGIGKSQIVILEALLRLRQAACHPGLIDKTRVAEPSAKLDELLVRLNTATESNERVLVFSQFTSLLAIVKMRLKQENVDFLYLDGKTKNRQALVEQFQSGTGPSVFLISLKAGGVGLNLTAARTVFLLDPWWNPAVEAQAIDRTHRIGQEQTVFATRFIAADTVEQKVLELQAKKRGLADAIVNADSAGISSLTRDDLELLLA
jgi:superfamily II DNA or RNA helicase